MENLIGKFNKQAQQYWELEAKWADKVGRSYITSLENEWEKVLSIFKIICGIEYHIEKEPKEWVL